MEYATFTLLMYVWTNFSRRFLGSSPQVGQQNPLNNLDYVVTQILYMGLN